MFCIFTFQCGDVMMIFVCELSLVIAFPMSYVMYLEPFELCCDVVVNIYFVVCVSPERSFLRRHKGSRISYTGISY